MIRNPILRGFLRPVSALFSAAVSLRAALYQRGFLKKIKVKPRVVSIGNLTVGGMGKTPLTMRVAALLQEQHQSVAVLCKGYKRDRESTIGVVSDGKRILADVSRSGDEAQLLARKLCGVPVVVGSPKWQAARWVESHLSVDWIVLDDGFQHLKLSRDHNVLLLDAERPFDNGQIVPLGALREPAGAIQRADILVLVQGSSGGKGSAEKLKSLCPSAELFRARRECVGVSMTDDACVRPAQQIIGKRLLAFCGLARPDQFFQDLHASDYTVVDSVVFPDHHRYHSRDARKILSRAIDCGAEALITTAKDAMNLSSRAFGNWPCYVFEIDMKIEDEPRFLRALLD